MEHDVKILLRLCHLAVGSIVCLILKPGFGGSRSTALLPLFLSASEAGNLYGCTSVYVFTFIQTAHPAPFTGFSSSVMTDQEGK